MKTTLGNNKNERQINRFKKNFDIELVHASNNYYYIGEIATEAQGELFYVAPFSIKFVKNGQLVVVKPMNWPADTPPIFLKPWSVVEITNEHGTRAYLIRVSKKYQAQNNEIIADLAQGWDDVWPVELDQQIHKRSKESLWTFSNRFPDLDDKYFSKVQKSDENQKDDLAQDLVSNEIDDILDTENV